MRGAVLQDQDEIVSTAFEFDDDLFEDVPRGRRRGTRRGEWKPPPYRPIIVDGQHQTLHSELYYARYARAKSLLASKADISDSREEHETLAFLALHQEDHATCRKHVLELEELATEAGQWYAIGILRRALGMDAVEAGVRFLKLRMGDVEGWVGLSEALLARGDKVGAALAAGKAVGLVLRVAFGRGAGSLTKANLGRVLEVLKDRCSESREDADGNLVVTLGPDRACGTATMATGDTCPALSSSPGVSLPLPLDLVCGTSTQLGTLQYRPTPQAVEWSWHPCAELEPLIKVMTDHHKLSFDDCEDQSQRQPREALQL